jgi:methionyl-tRNA formyltransferase
MKPLIFFGTPDFAVPTLEALVLAGMAPDLVVSQPARPARRGQKIVDPPVAVAARGLGLPLQQIEKVRDPAFLALMEELHPEVAVVVAFGQLFPPELLSLPRHGCINLHASLLPRWRGAAPIQAAIAAGDETTGVTTMVMEKGLDSGPMLLREEIAIGARETAGELSVRLAALGAPLVVETLRALAAGSLALRSQDPAFVTLAPKVRKEEARARWELPAVTLDRVIRAFQPWPGAELAFGEGWIRVISAEVVNGPAPAAAATVPGTVVAIERDRLLVAAGENSVLAILRAQRAGRGPVSGGELARALHLALSDRLS